MKIDGVFTLFYLYNDSNTSKCILSLPYLFALLPYRPILFLSHTPPLLLPSLLCHATTSPPAPSANEATTPSYCYCCAC